MLFLSYITTLVIVFRYDAAIREGLQAQNSPTRIALPRDKDGKVLHVSSNVRRTYGVIAFANDIFIVMHIDHYSIDV